MTSSGGDWVAVPIPGQPDRWDWVPQEQPPSPDGAPGTWHVVGGSGEGAGKWAWFPDAGPTPPPPTAPVVVMPWETIGEGLPSEPAADAASTAGSTSAAGPDAPSPWQPVAPGTPLPSQPVAQEPIGAPSAVQQPSGEEPVIAGWQAAPPVADDQQQRPPITLPLIILAIVVVLAVIGSVVAMVLSGGDDGKDKDAITAVANDVVTVADHKTVCSSHLTGEMVDTVFGDLATCEKNDENDHTVPPTSATVENIKISGKSATATVTLVGGDLDGTTGTWAFAKQENVSEGDQLWRVSEWQVDYLRSWFGKQLDENYKSSGPDDPFADDAVRSCISQKLRDLDDNGFRDTAYALLKESDEGATKMFDFMSQCPSDTADVSALRAYFEKEFRASAQLPSSITDCAVLAMRTALTEDDIKTLFVKPDEEHPEIQAKLQSVGADCAGAPTTINPTPEFTEPTTPGFGT